MVKKIGAVGIDVMRIGAAIAVIRYKDGYAGLMKVFNTLGVTPNFHLHKLCWKLVYLDMVTFFSRSSLGPDY